MTTMILPVSPKEAMNILNGKQTIIIRKSVPKLGLPIKVCLYCSDSKDYLLDKDKNYFLWDKHSHHYLYKYEGEPKEHYFQKKVIASFTLREVTEICFAPFGDELSEEEERICSESCLSVGELVGYLRDGMFGYAYHISSLIILDVPRRLSEFTYRRKYHGCKRCPYGNVYNPASDFSVCYTCSELLKVTRVRGAYMYVEDEE